MVETNVKNRTIFTGDNLDIMRGINSDSVDLIYLDPPFNSNANYSAPIGSLAAGAAFKDTWTLDDVDMAWHGLIADEHPALYRVIDSSGLSHSKGMKSYLIMMAVRLLEMKRILKETGSIYLHVDPTASHYLKLVMDCIFGKENFRNEIVWGYRGGGVPKVAFARKHDIFLFYAASKKTPFNPQYQPYSEASQKLVKNRGGKSIDGKERDLERGATMPDYWVDINSLQTWSPEKTGYPTQKPLALLERIIKASSNEGDVILDPFCGCATACVAAEKLNRKWVGIDLSSKAYELVYYRLGQMSLENNQPGDVIHRDDIPRRTDQGNLPKYSTHKHTLFGRQEGICAGCQEFFPFRNFTVDHIIPKAKGGTDHESNLQLLCGACNSMKGTKTQEEFIVLLKERGLRR